MCPQFPGLRRRAATMPLARYERVPRFYLHVCNGNGFAEDEEGLELPDVAAARERAINGLRDILASEMKQGEINLGSFIEMEDENHQLIATVPFIEAVRVTTLRGARPPK